MDCSVCLESFTEGIRKPVKCPHCEVESCMQCAKRTMLMWASDPKCSACNKPWSSDTVDTLFTKLFRRGPLRQQTIQNLLEQERSLFPQTSQRIDAEAAREELKHMQTLLSNTLNTVLSSRVALTDDLVLKIRGMKQRMTDLGRRTLQEQNEPLAARQARIATKCPGAGCLGYLNLASNCALCGIHVCKTCNKNVGTDRKVVHECNADDAASWALIKSECKMCPKCSTPVSKVDGCNQMWCTACNTAFDWASGRVVNGPIHNPHYAEFLRMGGGLQGFQGANVECVDGNFNYAEAVGMQRTLGYFAKGPLKLLVDHVQDYVRNVLELLDGRYQARFRAVPRYEPQSHEDLRRRVLTKQITQEQWASTLSARETVRTKMLRLFQVDEMMRAAAVDVLNRLCDDMRPLKAADVEKCKLACKRYYVSMREIHKYYVQCQVNIIADYSDKRISTLMHDPLIIVHDNRAAVSNTWSSWSLVTVRRWLMDFDAQSVAKASILDIADAADEVMMSS